MAIFATPTIFDKPLFHPRHLLWLHCLEVFLAVAAIALSIPRLYMDHQPITRANTIALSVGAKSIICITYQFLTVHVPACHRWFSLKANLILNCLDIPFWGGVMFLIMEAQIKQCGGETWCVLGWCVFGIAFIYNQLAVYGSVISYRAWYRAKHPVPACDPVSCEISQRVGSRDAPSNENHEETGRAPSEVTMV